MMNKDGCTAGRVAFGVDGLDRILSGGLPADKLYLIQGDPGSGKTTMALQFLMAGARLGEPVLYITLSESAVDLAGIAESHGWSLDGVTVHEVRVSTIDGEDDTEAYTVFHPGEVELNDLMRDFFAEAERLRPKRVVIDSLSEMRLLARDPLKYRRHLLSIRQFFTTRGCTVVVLDAAKAASEDLQANTLPHGVITMEHTAPAFGARRRRLIVTKLRGVAFDDGYHDMKIERGGVVVYPRMISAEHAPPADRSRTVSGVAAVDRMTGGGLQRGSSAVIMGSAGVGKSTLAGQYITAAAGRGERSAFLTFDETIHILLGRHEGMGIPLRRYVDDGTVAVEQIDPGEMSPGQFAHMVRGHVEGRGARVVVIDSLNGYLQASPDERFLLLQLHELITYMNRRGVVCILIIAQHGLLAGPISSTIDVSYLADTVFLLRYFESQGEVRKCISVVKNRTGAHELTIRELELGQGGVRVGLPLTGFHGVLTGTPTFEGITPPVEGEAHGGAGVEPQWRGVELQPAS